MVLHCKAPWMGTKMLTTEQKLSCFVFVQDLHQHVADSCILDLTLFLMWIAVPVCKLLFMQPSNAAHKNLRNKRMHPSNVSQDSMHCQQIKKKKNIGVFLFNKVSGVWKFIRD